MITILVAALLASIGYVGLRALASGAIFQSGSLSPLARAATRMLFPGRSWPRLPAKRHAISVGSDLVVVLDHGGVATLSFRHDGPSGHLQAKTTIAPLKLPEFLARPTVEGKTTASATGDALSVRFDRSYEVVGEHHGVLKSLSRCARQLGTTCLYEPEIESTGDAVLVTHPFDDSRGAELIEDMLKLLGEVTQLPGEKLKAFLDEPIRIERLAHRVKKSGSNLREQRIQVKSPSVSNPLFLWSTSKGTVFTFEVQGESVPVYDGELEGHTANPALPARLRVPGSADLLLALAGSKLRTEGRVVLLELPADPTRETIAAADAYLSLVVARTL